MGNPIPFATDAWIKRLRDECNRSESYREAARNWEGDIFFIVEPDGHLEKPVYMYMDLYHGQCRCAFMADNDQVKDPEFRVSGPMSVWRAIAERKMDPIKAVLTRKLSVQGNMAKVMRNVKAANELVNCTARFETEFPPS